MRELCLWEVASLYGKKLAPLGKRSVCPFREHKRRDKSFKVFRSKTGETLYKCFSCDPPFNIGDAVALYAALGNMDRKQAWNDLRSRGYKVPGMREGGRERSAPSAPVKPPPKPAPPTMGSLHRTTVLPLDLARWRAWQGQHLGAVERFAEQRKLSPALLRKLDVVDMDAGTIGFGYREPETRLPCRVKVRPLDRKTFWIEPRPERPSYGKALAPLYLAHLLEYAKAYLLTVVVITEGECDALSLCELGIRNAVSLPDGAQSAGTVDLSPIATRALWLSAMDADADGDRAHQALVARASEVGAEAGRVRWRSGDTTYKDANDALMAGMPREAFVRCLEEAAATAMGHEVRLAIAS